MHCMGHKKNRVESRALQASSCNNLNKGYCKLGQVTGDCSGRERVNSHAPPRTQPRGLESMVAQGFVKLGFKVLLHHVVDGPLQASRCLVSRTPCVYTRYTRVFWALGRSRRSYIRLASVQVKAVNSYSNNKQHRSNWFMEHVRLQWSQYST